MKKDGVPVETSTRGFLNLKKLGTYQLTYFAEYKGIHIEETRTFVVQDTLAPVIELVADPEHYTSPVATYEEEGFTAIDNYDGDITDQVIREEHDGIVTYTVTDTSGNTVAVDREIIYKDVIAPVITLNEGNAINFSIGNTFTDPGYSASDNIDGDITSKVTVSGSVDTNTMGRYKITYTVADAAGNTATKTRSILVYKKQAVANTVNPGSKVVYLTFDDGPGRYTGRLLDILDKFGVKATFFVTNQFPSYQYLIGDAHRRGHTIALHTATHQFANIYSSEEAYYNDLEIIHNICVAQTGVAPSIVRFPGGTNNATSKSYCAGLMTTLTQSLSYHGYLYCDWNVDSRDAGGATTSSAVAANVIAGIQKNNVSNVLMHDIKGYSVEAVEEIIFWGLENGYTFLPLNESSPMPRFSPRN